MPPVRRPWLVAAALLGSGCVAVAPVYRASAAPPRALPPQAQVLVVDGAGGFQGASRSLRQTAACDGLPWQVEPVLWTHGYLRVLADHLGGGHARAEGKKLAAQICARRRQCDCPPIYLVAHSAGCAVILSAAEALPPDSVERIILLAPAVSDRADLRPALACARQGVDVFYSSKDWTYLGIGIVMLGTADRHWRPAAGRVGFSVEATDPADGPLFAKLRQYPWDECLMWSGNLGGHYGAYQPNFLRAYVFPLIAPGTDCPAGPPAVARGPASPAATLAASSPVINRAERLRVR